MEGLLDATVIVAVSVAVAPEELIVVRVKVVVAERAPVEITCGLLRLVRVCGKPLTLGEAERTTEPPKLPE